MVSFSAKYNKKSDIDVDLLKLWHFFPFANNDYGTQLIPLLNPEGVPEGRGS